MGVAHAETLDAAVSVRAAADPRLAPALRGVRSDLTASVAASALVVPTNLRYTGAIALWRRDRAAIQTGGLGAMHDARAGSMSPALALRFVR